MIDVIGHVAYASVAFGTLLLARDSPYGWAFRASGDAVWVALGFALGLTSIWMWETAFLAVDLYAIRQWTRGAPQTY